MGDAGEYAVWTDRMQERRRSVLTEGRWKGKMGSTIYCVIRGHWQDGGGVPSPAIKSDKYFAGIKILTRLVNVSESEQETQIQFQSTVPIGCLPQFEEACKLSVQVAQDDHYQAKRCVDGRMRQVVFGDCSVDIRPSNWRDVHTVSVKAVRDFYTDGNKRMMVDFKPAYSTMLSDIWSNYQLPRVEIIAKDAPTKMCVSTGDPHYKTFDGLYYHVYLEGEFVLYKHAVLPIQINTRLERCGKTVSCNCAVAVKAGDDVIVIDRCQRRKRNLAFGESFPEGWRTLHRHALEQGGEFVKGLTIYEYDGGKRYTIHLPTGAYLDFRVGDHWINIYMHASSDDWQATLGLCGTFDGDKYNDFTFPDGVTKTVPRDHDACGEMEAVCKFAESWRVEDRHSFFGPVVEIQLEEQRFLQDHQFCKCEADETNPTRSRVVCNYHYDVDNCQAREEQSHGFERTNELLLKSRSKRTAELHDEEDDYFNSVFVYDRQYVGKEPQWPTPSGITEAQARQYCHQFVMGTTVARLCHSLMRDQMKTLIDECMTDIKVTDDMSWALSSLTSLTSECADAIHTNPRYWNIDVNDLGNQSTPIQEDQPDNSAGARLLKRICPSDCSKHGDCQAGACVCHYGFGGSDCSQKLLEPPKVYHLSNGGLCDRRTKACREVRVYGTNFRNATTLTCHFWRVEFSEDGLKGLEVPSRTNGIFETFEELRCRLPENEGLSPYMAYIIKISNDPSHTTTPMVVIVYDAKCHSCFNLGNASYCTERNESCEVNGKCYLAGDRDPTNCCRVCRPEITRSMFTDYTTDDSDRIPPQLYPLETAHDVTEGDEWSLTIYGESPRGCDVRLEADDSGQSTITAHVSGAQVQLTLNSQGPGIYTVIVTAHDQCGAQTRKSYEVTVKENMEIACAGNQPPVFLTYPQGRLALNGYDGQLLEARLLAEDPEGGDVGYDFANDTIPAYISLSDDGLLRYEANSDHPDEVTITAKDNCGNMAFLNMFASARRCPCQNSGKCQIPDGLVFDPLAGNTHYTCACRPGYEGTKCQIFTGR